MEASKASTGSLSVHLDRLGMVQLVQQALGEFEEKFAQSRLTVVPAFPEEECSILADGRHLWRVIDNLLSNCNKYALEGTRIYVEVCRWEGKVVLSIKNISRQPLNIPAERLMERFVRGRSPAPPRAPAWACPLPAASPSSRAAPSVWTSTETSSRPWSPSRRPPDRSCPRTHREAGGDKPRPYKVPYQFVGAALCGRPPFPNANNERPAPKGWPLVCFCN